MPLNVSHFKSYALAAQPHVEQENSTGIAYAVKMRSPTAGSCFRRVTAPLDSIEWSSREIGRVKNNPGVVPLLDLIQIPLVIVK